MKLTDFGLWFGYSIDEDDNLGWSTAIPQEDFFYILYDGVRLGHQYSDFELDVYDGKQFIIKLKNNFKLRGYFHRIGRRLTLDDFEIIPNPDCRGDL